MLNQLDKKFKVFENFRDNNLNKQEILSLCG